MSMFSILCIFPEKLGLQHCEYWGVCVWKAAAELNVITKLNSKNTSNPHFFEKLFFRHYLCWSSLDIYKFHVSFCLLRFFLPRSRICNRTGAGVRFNIFIQTWTVSLLRFARILAGALKCWCVSEIHPFASVTLQLVFAVVNTGFSLVAKDNNASWDSCWYIV